MSQSQKPKIEKLLYPERPYQNMEKIIALGIISALLLSLLVLLPLGSASPISITDVQTNWEEHGIFEDRYYLGSVDITVKNTGSSGWRLYRCRTIIEDEEGGQIHHKVSPVVPVELGRPDYIYINPGETKRINVPVVSYFYPPGRYTVKIALSHTPPTVWGSMQESEIVATYECTDNVGGINVPGFSSVLSITAIIAAFAGLQLWKRRHK